jgi:OOP family OmpA-OmpF porin
MKMKRIGLMLMACSAVFSAGTVNASQDNDWYLGGGLGLSYLDPETNNTGYRIENDKDRGWKMYLGYDLNQSLSIEAYYADMGEADMAPNGRIGYVDYGLSGIYYFRPPLLSDEGLSAFARLGVGRMKNDTDLDYDRENDNHLMFGAGLEYALDNGFAIRADVDMYDKDAHLVTIGLLKRFGGEAPPKDTDGDGVFDLQDQCPNTAPGEKVDAKGCALPKDSDGDSVLDPQDQCPNTAPGEKVDAKGCALPKDSDGDGIFDPDDQCPDTAPGEKVDTKGCVLETVIDLKGVSFATNSAELVGESDKILTEMAEILKRYPDQRVEVAGHTDSQGSAVYNRKLSALRANAVREYLVEKGVNTDMLTSNGYGEEKPIADNGTAEGRAMNRRVELHLLK